MSPTLPSDLLSESSPPHQQSGALSRADRNSLLGVTAGPADGGEVHSQGHHPHPGPPEPSGLQLHLLTIALFRSDGPGVGPGRDATACATDPKLHSHVASHLPDGACMCSCCVLGRCRGWQLREASCIRRGRSHLMPCARLQSDNTEDCVVPAQSLLLLSCRRATWPTLTMWSRSASCRTLKSCSSSRQTRPSP